MRPETADLGRRIEACAARHDIDTSQWLCRRPRFELMIMEMELGWDIAIYSMLEGRGSPGAQRAVAEWQAVHDELMVRRQLS